MKPESQITPEQKKYIKAYDKDLQRVMTLQEDMKRYKIGDVYLIEECWESGKWQPVKGSLGHPHKYQVVHISDFGVPYLRRLSTNNKPTGTAFPPPEVASVVKHDKRPDELMYIDWTTCRMVADPEQLDAILLQQEFVPNASMKETHRIFNEVNKHNKSVTVPTSWGCHQKIAEFFKSLKPGDKFWTGPDKVFVIHSITKQAREYDIHCVDQNQAEQHFCFSDFNNKRLYRAAPRSFAKEKAI